MREILHNNCSIQCQMCETTKVRVTFFLWAVSKGACPSLYFYEFQSNFTLMMYTKIIFPPLAANIYVRTGFVPISHHTFNTDTFTKFYPP